MGWFEPERKHRQSIRLKGYDYSRRGAYFITMCVQHASVSLARCVAARWG
jgi:putative transposase